VGLKREETNRRVGKEKREEEEKITGIMQRLI